MVALKISLELLPNKQSIVFESGYYPFVYSMQGKSEDLRSNLRLCEDLNSVETPSSHYKAVKSCGKRL